MKRYVITVTTRRFGNIHQTCSKEVEAETKQEAINKVLDNMDLSQYDSVEIEATESRGN